MTAATAPAVAAPEAGARSVLDRCERAARTGGLAAGLAVALRGVDVAATAPGRWAAVPEADVPAGAPVRRLPLATAEGVAFLACPGAGPGAGPGADGVARAVAAVRLGLLRRLLDAAVEHLGDRCSDGSPLLGRQLVTGTVADVLTGVELLRAGLRAGPGAASVTADLHTRVDELGWEVSTLFGAAGYLTGHPARALHVAALVAHTWIPAEGAS